MVYFIVTTYFEGKNEGSYAEYIEKVKPIVEKHGGRYLTRSEQVTALSEKWTPQRVIVIEFDSREQLDTCFSSEEYRAISYLRENSVDARAIIVE